ncbi:MAG: leucyl aminopeptidase [Campylobacterota bacterium]
MKITLNSKDFKDISSDLEIVLINDLDKCEDEQVLESLDFKATDEACVLLPELKKLYVAYEDETYDSLAVAIATGIKKFQSTNFKTAKVNLKDKFEDNIKALVEGAILGSYKFDTYKSDKKEKKKQELTLVVGDEKEYKSLLKESKTIAKAVNKVRDMVNTPASDFYPEVMANLAKELASDVSIDCKTHSEKFLENNHMNTMLSVGRASIHESHLIHMSYKPENPKKKIVLVGKGLTYDSGGLSLKPANFMTTMKSDKAGGCAVMATLWAVAKLKLPFEVHGIVGAVENMIGGDAYKPDDVLTAKNGKTIEVKNTDAEGRLVLADCLCYAQDEIEDIDYIFDYATLTGASVVGVGEYTTTIMGNSEELKEQAVVNSVKAGEYATKLDFNRFLKKTLKSEVADISNIASSRYGGAITAGMFLDNFICEENKDKWLHFDIAGPGFVEHSWGYNPYGGSGAGVRMTIEFLKNLK